MHAATYYSINVLFNVGSVALSSPSLVLLLSLANICCLMSFLSTVGNFHFLFPCCDIEAERGKADAHPKAIVHGCHFLFLPVGRRSTCGSFRGHNLLVQQVCESPKGQISIQMSTC